MVTKQETRMLNGGLTTEFSRFVFPSVFGMLAISSASVIDGIFIGNFVGATALASVILVMPLLAFAFGVLIMVSLGAAVVSGKYLGEGDINEASNMFSKAGILATLVMATIGALTLILPEQIVAALGAKGETIALSARYLWVIAWFFPAFAVAVLLSQFARVDGRPGISFLAMMSITVVNIAFDFIMVAWLDWGLTGAALATGLAYLTGALIPLVHFLGPRAKLAMIRPYGTWYVLVRSTFNGFSEFLNETSSGLVLLLFNWILITQVGTLGVASFAIVDYIIYFGILIFYGVAEGIVPLISVNFGGRKPDRILRFLILGVGFSTLIGAGLMALLLIWPERLIGVFLRDAELEIQIFAVSIITIIWPVFIFSGANITISAYFTGMHRAIQSSTIAIVRSLILPVCLILLFWNWFGVMGAFYALPVAEGLTFILSVSLLYSTLPGKLMASTPPHTDGSAA